MTAIDQQRFEEIPLEDTPTPAWEAYRRQRGDREGDHVLPRGTFEAELIEADMLRRKDGSGYVLRLVARTIGLGKYVIGWRGLGSNGMDPWDLTESEVKGLRKWAQGMGLPTPAPAREIVAALQAQLGHPVTVKVVHTPVGIQGTFTRNDAADYVPSTLRVGGRLIVADGHAIDEGDGSVVAGAAADAFVAHTQIVDGVARVNEGLAYAMKGCYDLEKSKGWAKLGFATLNEYLAQPEVTVSRTDFYRLAAIYEAYVLDGGVPAELLAGASPSKLELPIPAIEQGVVSAEQAVSDAESLTRKDLRERYRVLLGDAPADGGQADGGAASGPVRESEPPHPRAPVVEALAPDVDVQRLQALADEFRASQHETEMQLQEELDRVAELRTRAEAAEERERQVRAELERLEVLEDAAQIETVVGAAKTIAATLHRVLVEIGAPEQKRMGKQLRAAVQDALALASEHGLGA